MKKIVLLCGFVVLCLTATGAMGTTAIVTEDAPVYKNAKEIIETLPAGSKVTTGKVNKNWIQVSYLKKDQKTSRTGWVALSKLEEIRKGFADARVSAHCILHVQDASYADRFDLKKAEDFYAGAARSLVNARDEPAFDPNVKLRIYLLNRESFNSLKKQQRQPEDSVGFSPTLGQVYLDFSLRTASTIHKGLIVHEYAMLVLREYARQPKNRSGAGAALPLWLIESFAVYHEYQAGFNTDNLIYVQDKPRLTTLSSMPNKEKDRDSYLATAGTLGHMLLNYGTSEQFSALVRAIQAGAGRENPRTIMLNHYKLSRAKFQAEWARYVDQLKEQYGIRKREDELKDREDEDDSFDPSDPIGSPRAWVDSYLKDLLPDDLGPIARRSVVSRVRSVLDQYR